MAISGGRINCVWVNVSPSVSQMLSMKSFISASCMKTFKSSRSSILFHLVSVQSSLRQSAPRFAMIKMCHINFCASREIAAILHGNSCFRPIDRGRCETGHKTVPIGVRRERAGKVIYGHRGVSCWW